MNDIYTILLDKKSFENKLYDDSEQLYYHLINVCVLGRQLPKMVPHWVHQIYYYSYKAITTSLKPEYENLDRYEVIENMMMKPLMGVNFQDYDSSQFKDALESEKNNAMNRLNNYEWKHMWDYLNAEIDSIDTAMKYVEIYAKVSKSLIQEFYDDYRESVREMNLGMLLTAIANFAKSNSMQKKVTMLV